MVFLYYVPEIIYKFILDLFSIKRTFTGYGYNLKYNSNWKKIKNNLYNSKYKCLFFLINSSNLIKVKLPQIVVDFDTQQQIH